MSPADSGDDPNIAPYPGRYEVARTKGVPPNEEPVPLDITGFADLQEQVDRVAELVGRGPVLDGGVSVDLDARTVVVRIVGPIDGTSLEVERLKSTVLATAGDLTVDFRSVQYSRAELLELADSIFLTQGQWGPGGTGISGGWNCNANQVIVLIERDTDETQTWINLILSLADDRITIQTYTLPE